MSALFEDVRIFGLGGAEEAASIEEAVADIETEIDLLPRGIATHRNVAHHRAHLSITIGGEVYVLTSENGAQLVPRDPIEIPRGHDLVTFFQALQGDVEIARSKRQHVVTQVNVLLASSSTVEGLLQTWPEAAALLPEGTAPEPRAPRDANIDDLNELLGL